MNSPQTAVPAPARALPSLMVAAASLGVGATLLFPAIPWLMEQFPEHSAANVAQAATLPTLVSVPFIILAGSVVGRTIGNRRIGARPIFVGGLAVFTIGGLIPFLVQGSWSAIIVGSVLRGIGEGAAALPTALAATLWTGRKKQTNLGLVVGSVSLGSMLGQIIGGELIDLGINPWLAHIVGVIGIAAVLIGVPEPTLDGPGATAEDPAAGPVRPGRLPGAAIGLIALIPAAMMLAAAALVAVPQFLVAENITTAGGAGTANSMFNLFTFVSALLFGALTKVLGRFWYAIGPLIAAAGLWTAGSAGSLTVAVVAMALIGFGFYGGYLGSASGASTISPLKSVPLAMALVMATSAGGTFLSPYFIELVQTISGNSSLRPVLHVAAVLNLVIAAIFLLWNPMKRRTSDPEVIEETASNSSEIEILEGQPSEYRR